MIAPFLCPARLVFERPAAGLKVIILENRLKLGYNFSMNDWGTKFIIFTNTSPTFKGGTVLFAGLLALLFAYWMNKHWREPLKGGFLVFIGLAGFVVMYGLFILLFQPHWWNPPY
jgi:hypothetical protein